MRWIGLSLCGIVLLPSLLRGQQPKNGKVPEVDQQAQLLPRKTIDLTHVETLPGLPNATVMGLPLCSSDGTVFYEVYAAASSTQLKDFPDIYRISESREVKKVAIPLPREYKQVVLLSLYASSDSLIALIEAYHPKVPDPLEPAGQEYSFLSITDQDGARPRLVEIHLPFSPMKAAIFTSGTIIVLGMDRANIQPALALVNSDGSVSRMLDLDLRSPRASEDRKSTETVTFSRSQRTLNALGAMQFIPWGDEILLLQPGTQQPVYKLTDGGLQDAVNIQIPKGFLLASILGSGEKDEWLVRASTPQAFQSLADGKVLENNPEQLFDVNPVTGEVIDQISLKGPHAQELTCAANGKLSAIYYGGPAQPPGGADQLTYASAPR